MRQLHAPSIRDGIAELRSNADLYAAAWGDAVYQETMRAQEELLRTAEQQDAERVATGLPF